jgi:hypothetical protein
MTVVLREAQDEVTLDDALMEMRTFGNGCDYRLRFEGDRVFLEYGCYGVHPNLQQGKARLLTEWLDGDGPGGWRELTGQVEPETLVLLKARKPCLRCGGFLFKAA